MNLLISIEDDAEAEHFLMHTMLNGSIVLGGINDVETYLKNKDSKPLHVYINSATEVSNDVPKSGFTGTNSSITG